MGESDAKFIVEACNNYYQLKSDNDKLNDRVKELKGLIDEQRTTLSKQYDVMVAAQEFIQEVRTGERPATLDFKYNRNNESLIEKYDSAMRALHDWTQKQISSLLTPQTPTTEKL